MKCENCGGNMIRSKSCERSSRLEGGFLQARLVQSAILW